jgi:hypothetical protein
MKKLRAATASTEDLDDAFQAGQDLAQRILEKTALGGKSLGILFASIRFDHEALLRGIKSKLDLPIVGCTTHSEATEDGFFDDSASLVVLTADSLAFGIGLGEGISKNPDAAVTAACDAAAAMLGSAPRLAIVLPDAALSYTGEVVLAKLRERFGVDVPIIGGLPGDGGRLKQTFQFFGERVTSDSIPVVLLGGDITPVVVTRSGWIPIGQKAIATKTRGTTLLEIDGRPAIEYLKRYVANVDDPEVLAMYPLAIVDGTLGVGMASYFVIRAPFFYDKATGAVTYGGSVAEGATVQLVKGTRDDIVAGAREAATVLAERLAGKEPSVVLFFSCAGRKLMLGMQTAREIEALTATFDVPVAGFYA